MDEIVYVNCRCLSGWSKFCSVLLGQPGFDSVGVVFGDPGELFLGVSLVSCVMPFEAYVLFLMSYFVSVFFVTCTLWGWAGVAAGFNFILACVVVLVAWVLSLWRSNGRRRSACALFGHSLCSVFEVYRMVAREGGFEESGSYLVILWFVVLWVLLFIWRHQGDDSIWGRLLGRVVRFYVWLNEGPVSDSQADWCVVLCVIWYMLSMWVFPFAVAWYLS